ALGQRHIAVAVVVLADRGAGAPRRARHAAQLAAQPAGRVGGVHDRPRAAVLALGQRHVGGAVGVVVLAGRGAGAGRRAGPAAPLAVCPAGRVGGVLFRPRRAAAVARGRRDGGAAGVVFADGGAGARRRARHAAQEALRRASRVGGGLDRP